MRGGNIFRPRPLENFLATLRPVMVIAVDGKKNSAMLYPPFVALGFILRYSHSNERADNSAQRTQRARSRQRSDNRSRRDERSDTGDRKHADASQPSENAPGHRARRRASCRSFRRLGVFLVRKIFSSRIIGEKRGNIRVSEACMTESVHCLFCRLTRVINAESCYVFLRHDLSPNPCWSNGSAKPSPITRRARIVCKINMAEFEIGAKREEVLKVGHENAITFLGMQGPRVLSTPQMILFMERACRNLVLSMMDPGHDTLGTHVNVSHCAAAPMGASVTFIAELLAVNERRVEFRVEARYGEKIVGEGTHQRTIVEVARFAEKMKNAALVD